MSSSQNEKDENAAKELHFEWYPLKAAANLKKHKVSFEEATTIFGDEKLLVIPDQEHNDEEERYLAFGRSEQGRLLTICFTERGERIRMISARLAERWERREYETADE